MQKTFCDRCGEQILDGYKEKDNSFLFGISQIVEAVHFKVDICNKCEEAFKSWFRIVEPRNED